ncbi:conserved hypothetical protein [Arthrobacter sp. 9V]|uniref:hypothetical protein n=1 Tax=Arthrobacter sp. 9V TaxID=2653132 RepID=UPI0012F1B477|nr:hypothetical protein [Arthrobacter sp. 9V]VXC15384.1 conserved hypothetical protein [Arthrobacter sp. 9V]
MELLDAHTVVISAVLLVHFTGVMIVAASIAGLVISLFIVVLGVHSIRTTWELTQNWRSRGRFYGSVKKVLGLLKAGALAVRPLIIEARRRISQLFTFKPE